MSTINEIGRSPFWVKITVDDLPQITEYTNRWDVLVACKTAAQTKLFGHYRNQRVELVAQAGQERWHWDVSCNNTLKGMGETRDWQIFKSFDSAVANAN